MMYCNANGCKWECLDEDTFCGYCGLPLRRVEVRPRGLAFHPSDPAAKHKTLRVKNDGLFPVKLRIGQSAPSRDWVKIQFPQKDTRLSLLKCLVAVEDGSFLDYPHQDSEVTLGVGAELEAEVLLSDESRIQGREMDGQLLLRGQGLLDDEGAVLEMLRLPVTHGAVPEVTVTPREELVMQFGVERAQIDFRLRSAGRGFATLDGPPQASVHWLAVKHWRATPQAPGTEEIVSFRAIPARCRPGKHPVTFTFHIMELPRPVVLETEVTVRLPAKAHPSRSYLDLGELTPYSVRRETITLQNRGEDDLQVLGTPRIEPPELAKKLQLVEEDSSHRRIRSDQTGDPGKSFLLTVDGRNLDVGDHRARLIFQLNDPARKTLEIPVAFRRTKLQPTQDLLALDFGTTNCCIAIFPHTFKARILDLRSAGQPHPVYEIPTVLYARGKNDYLIGEEARNVEESAPERTISSIKRHLGSDTLFKLPEGSFAPRDVARIIMEHLWQRAAASLGEAPHEVVLTAPCNFDRMAIENLLWAAREAGFQPREDPEMILDEPSAAAFYYIHSQQEALRKKSKHHKLLVYDFGGGTLDISLLEVEFGENPVTRITALEVDGIHLGGDDLDDALMRLYVERLEALKREGTVAGLDEVDFERILRPVEGDADLELLANRTILRRVAEEVKRKLSVRPEEDGATIQVPFPTINLRGSRGRPIPLGPSIGALTVSRGDFEARIQGLLERGQMVLDAVLKRAEMTPDQVDILLLTGGTSHVPLVRRMVRALCPRAEIPSPAVVPPKQSVAQGAAIYAGMKQFEQPGVPAQLVIEPLRNRVSFSIGTYDPAMRFTQILTRGALPIMGEYEMGMPDRPYALLLIADRGEPGPHQPESHQYEQLATVTVDPEDFPEIRTGQKVRLDFFFNRDRQLEVELNRKKLPVKFKKDLKGGVWI